MSARPGNAIAARAADHDWDAAFRDIDAWGRTIVPGILTAEECSDLAALYSEERRFRSHIVMARHGFGSGEYRYFRYPLPEPVQQLRCAFYPYLADLANAWNARMGLDRRYPRAFVDWLGRCHAAGQARPTPLLLRYAAGDFNCLHQDLYGDLVFPLQMAVLLSEPGQDFTGGEFILTEQRPRMQSRAEVVQLRKGDAVLFAVSSRPVEGRRGVYRVAMRHGVSRLLSGRRTTLGVIFHDAA